MGIDTRTKAAMAAMMALVESCTPQSYRLPENAPVVSVPEVPVSTPPAHGSSEDFGQLCPPKFQHAAEAVAKKSFPISTGRGETVVNYTLTTDENFEEYYRPEEAGALKEHYASLIARKTSFISEYVNIRFNYTEDTMPEEHAEQLWFNIVLSGLEGNSYEAGLTIPSYKDGVFDYAEIMLFVPTIERQPAGFPVVPEVMDWQVQHQLEHGLGLTHMAYVFPDIIDYSQGYDFTPEINPGTTAMTHSFFFNYDTKPELDLCALQELYGERRPAPGEVEPSATSTNGSSRYNTTARE